MKFACSEIQIQNVIVEKKDLYDLDKTISSLLLPLIREFYAEVCYGTKGGIPRVKKEHVPEHLCLCDDEKYYNFLPNSLEEAEFKGRYVYVLREILFAFSFYSGQKTPELEFPNVGKFKTQEDRASNGLKLFAEYFFTFWF